MQKFSLSLLLSLVFLFSCKSLQTPQSTDDGALEFIILQLNDVYELSPGKGDDLGGLARVASLRKQLLAENPNVLTVLAGDFISPSVFSTTKYEGKNMRGLQIIESLNVMGLDIAAFGNHEFDYKLDDLKNCLDKSTFDWLGTNVFLKTKDGHKPFYKKTENGEENCPETIIIPMQDADGTSINVGLFGATLDVNPKPWLTVTDPFETAVQTVEKLKSQTDLSLGLTHLFLRQDSLLATKIPSVPLLMGGHEHDGHFIKVGKTSIAKARSNAKTAYVHHIKHIKKTGKTSVVSEAILIDKSFPDEPSTALTVKKWDNILYSALKEQGFSPDKIVVELGTALDCRDEYLRSNQAPFGNMLTSAMLAVSKHKPDCAIFNSGSVRMDDYIDGQITELDIVRLLPYGGGFSEVEMRGSLLERVLIAGENQPTNGGYLQRNGCGYSSVSKTWNVQGKPIEADKIYTVALPDFLLLGIENGIEFLKANITTDGGTDNPDVLNINRPTKGDESDYRNDIRQTLMNFLRN